MNTIITIRMEIMIEMMIEKIIEMMMEVLHIVPFTFISPFLPTH